MDTNEFISAFAEQFEDIDTQSITADTNFKELADWDSMTVLSVLSMIKLNYGVNLPAFDINQCATVKDIFALVEKANG